MDEVILAAYDVAVGLSGWRHLVASLAEALDLTTLAIFLFDDRSGAGDLLARTGESGRGEIESWLAIARQRTTRPGDASRPDGPPRYPRLSAGAGSGRTARWNSRSDSAAGDYLAGMAIGGTGETLWLCVGVGIDSPIAAEDVQEKVERVLPHLCRAAEIEGSLRAAAERSAFADAVFHRLPFGLVEFDRNAVVIYANAEAQRMSRLREGFAIVSGKARAGSSAEDAALQGALRDAIAAPGGTFTRWLNVRRGTGQRPYRMLVTTMGDRSDGRRASSCVVFIADPERMSTMDPEAIADAFGLTAAEAKVVARLAMGISLPDIAGNLKVSINTVRTLLARAMGKTSTNTQVALVRMVLTTFCVIG